MVRHIANAVTRIGAMLGVGTGSAKPARPQPRSGTGESSTHSPVSRRVFLGGVAVALPAAALIKLTPEELSEAPTIGEHLGDRKSREPHGLADIPTRLPNYHYRWVRLMLKGEVDTGRMASARAAGWQVVMCEGSTYTYGDLTLCARPS